MSGDEITDAAADRLEAALERIAEAAKREPVVVETPAPQIDSEEIAARLDGLIDRLRTALASRG